MFPISSSKKVLEEEKNLFHMMFLSSIIFTMIGKILIFWGDSGSSFVTSRLALQRVEVLLKNWSGLFSMKNVLFWISFVIINYGRQLKVNYMKNHWKSETLKKLTIAARMNFPGVQKRGKCLQFMGRVRKITNCIILFEMIKNRECIDKNINWTELISWNVSF